MKTKIVIVALLCMLGLGAQAEMMAMIGSDADTYVSGSDIMGAKDYMSVLGGGADDAGYLRFDLGALNVTTVLDAQLILRNSPTVDSTGHDERNDGINVDRFALHGLNNVTGNTPQDWDESTLTESSAGSEWNGTVPLDLTGGRVTNLDEGDDGVEITEDIYDDPALDYWIAGNYTITISGQSLIDFLQARADDGGLATFIIASEDSNTKGYGIGTKENATEELRPVLTLTYIAGGASNPQPADGVTITDLDLSELCWDNTNVEVADTWFGTGVDVNEVNYKDYLTLIGSIESPDATTCQSLSEYTPLDVPETYYWVVETYGYPESDPNHLGEPNALLSNDLWNFTTSALPLAQTSPVNQFVFDGDTASFSVQFLALTPVTDATWYLNDTDVETLNPDDVTISITDDDSNLYTVTLTIDNVESADEGTYYCVAENSGGFSEPSESADLIDKRLLAEYKFAGNLDDSSENGAPSGTAMDSQGDPNTLTHIAGMVHYVTGADGTEESAVYLDPNEYINFGVEGYPKASAVTSNGFGGGLDEGTIIFWVKPNVDVQQVILANFNDGGATGFMTLLQADQDIDLYIRGESGNPANHTAGQPDRPEYDLTDGNWHMMAACWSGDTSTVYVNGQWVASRTDSTSASFAAWQRGTLLGATRTSTDRDFLSDMFAGGAIDNLRIYNYRLDDEGSIIDAFSQEYLDNTGIRPCINMSFLTGLPSTNFDNTGASYCIVDLADLAVFVSNWLNCGLYPSCP